MPMTIATPSHVLNSRRSSGISFLEGHGFRAKGPEIDFFFC
jgi:hypothetical protein